MARGHSHGHSHSHHRSTHHGHHHRTGRGRSFKNEGAIFETSIDQMVNYPVPPSLINGVYTFVGNQLSFRAQVEGGPAPQYMPQINLMQQNMMAPPNMMQEMLLPNNPMMPMQGAPMPMPMPMPGVMPGAMPMGMPPMPVQSMTVQGNEMAIQQANITLVGSKVKPSGSGCFIATVFLGSCLIFPLFFMCCMWWKKLVFPSYELSLNAYQSLSNFLAKAVNANNLNLTIVDSAFNLQKARVLYEALSRSRITGLTFNNRALACNGNANELDEFRANMTPIKSLSLTSSITWGDMTF